MNSVFIIIQWELFKAVSKSGTKEKKFPFWRHFPFMKSIFNWLFLYPRLINSFQEKKWLSYGAVRFRACPPLERDSTGHLFYSGIISDPQRFQQISEGLGKKLTYYLMLFLVKTLVAFYLIWDTPIRDFVWLPSLEKARHLRSSLPCTQLCDTWEI